MRIGRRLWVALVAGMGLTACVDLNSPPPAIRKPPQELSEKDTGVFAVGGHTSIDIPLPDGRTLLSASGQVAARMGGTQGAADLLDAATESRLPEYESRLVVGRLRYTVGSQVIDIDHRLDVRAPSRRATLRAERAQFLTDTLEFVIAGRARLTYDGTVIALRQARAKLDLRSASGLDLVAKRGADQNAWTVRATRGDVDGMGRVVFSEVTGEFTTGGKPATFEAPRAAWHPKAAQLNFEQGMVIKVAESTVRAEAATYEQANRRVVTRGATTLERAGLSVKGSAGVVDLAARRARLNQIVARLGGDSLRADSGWVGEDRTLHLTGVTATMADGTSLRAGAATYREGNVTATGGVRVSQKGSTLTAQSATRSAGGAMSARGNVRINSNGVWATGQRLTANRDLTQYTLSPIRAGGQSDEGAWSLSASQGRGSKSGGVVLESASGVFNGPGRRATASAGRAVYSPSSKQVTFSGGFRLSSPSDGLTVTAQGGMYDSAGRTFRLTGNVRADVEGVAISGRTWVYRLGRGKDEPVVESAR